MFKQSRIIVLLMGATLFLGGCIGPTRGGMNHDQMMNGTPIAGMEHSRMMSGTVMTSTMMTGTMMSGMEHGAMMDPDQPFDAQFIDGMIKHHQGAVEMAQTALEQSDRAEVRQLAAAVIATQTPEIEQMTAWRTAWYPDLSATAGMQMGMGDMAISTDESVPFDQRFLTAMISHHQGAINMATMAQTQAEHAEIQQMAAAIISAQQAEIEQMQMWLIEWFGVEAAAQSAFVAQLDSPVRGLSAQEVDDLRAGHGMGYARMAELNNHPGPRHLLDLSGKLDLTEAQTEQVTEIFTAMQAKATQLGEEIVAREAELSALFAAGDVDQTKAQAQVTALADLYGQLRFVHLRAHLQVTLLLSPAQIVVYNQLRGYGDGTGQPHAAGMDHHRMHD